MLTYITFSWVITHHIDLKLSRLRLWLRKLEVVLLVVHKLAYFDTPQVVLARQGDIVVEQVPLSFELDDRVVRGPPLDGLQDSAGVCEGAERRVALGIC